VAGLPLRLRRFVTARAKNRCEYCLSPAEQTGIPMTIDHIIPRAHGGVSEADNLGLACSRCNWRKRDLTHAYDFATHRLVQLFHPRRQRWARHFRWSEDGTRIGSNNACRRSRRFILSRPIRQVLSATTDSFTDRSLPAIHQGNNQRQGRDTGQALP
jgi:hypothetical protein